MSLSIAYRHFWAARAVMLGMVVMSCGGGPGPPPTISAFTASPATIKAGETATLGWAVTGEAWLWMNPKAEDVSGMSQWVAAPTATTTYVLTAVNSSGVTSANATVVVEPADQQSPPTIETFTASPATASAPGTPVILSWTVRNATSIAIDQRIGDVTGTTLCTVTPRVTTTYTLTATNAVGEKTAAVTVTIAAGPLPAIATFIATPAAIAPGVTATLSWNVANADTVSLDQGIGTVTGSSISVRPTVTTTYTLTASNEAGNGSAQVTVAVLEPPAILSFRATPPTVKSGKLSVLSWDVTGETAVTIDQGIGTVTGTSRSVSPTLTTVYTLTATNPVGSSQATVTVKVH